MIRKTLLFFVLSILVMTGLISIHPPIIAITHAQSVPVIQSQETDFPGIVAELIQCQRKKGVLTVKVRVNNTSSKTVRVYWQDPKKTVYLMDAVNQKKYFLLKDATGEFIYSGAPWDISPNTSKISWFKFPAPPPDVKEITFILPGCAPFEDVLIEDK